LDSPLGEAQEVYKSVLQESRYIQWNQKVREN